MMPVTKTAAAADAINNQVMVMRRGKFREQKCHYFESGLPQGLKKVARLNTLSSIGSPSCKAERLHWIQLTNEGKRPKGETPTQEM